MLDPLADALAAGGFNTEIDIHTRTGGLLLDAGHSLVAQTINLTADDPNGQINLNGGVIDASGAAGGTISLYGHVITLNGALLAEASGSTQSGGKITVGISIGTTSGQTDPTYGYEVVDPSIMSGGLLTLGQNMVMNVSGGLGNGSINMRLPLVTGGGVDLAAAFPDTPANHFIGAKDFIIEPYAVWSTTDNSTGALHFDGIIDPAGVATSTGAVTTNNTNHIGFYQNTLSLFVEGTTNPAINPGVTAGISSYLSALTGTAFHMQPGIELRNPSSSINNGDITVASNWDLAAGTMSNLQSTSLNYNIFDNTTSVLNFVFRYGIEPGDLTLRAAGDINVNASISDGFYQFQNLIDANYLSGVVDNTNPWTPLQAAPVPSNYATPQISPSNTGLANSLSSYDLFPDQLNVFNRLTGQTQRISPNSWSYTFTAGADMASSSPNAVAPLSTFAGNTVSALLGHGSVIVNGHTTYSGTDITTLKTEINSNDLANFPSTLALPTMIRTGTGSISINAGLDVVLADHSAPGVIYTAGRNAPSIADPNFAAAGTSGFNPGGFIEPNIIAYGNGASQAGGALGELGKLTGPPTAPAFPVGAGDILITAQRDIVGWQNVTIPNTTTPLYQFYSPWLMAQYSGTLGEGAYAYTALAGGTFSINPQTAWWIEFGRFDQGVLSAGGNVTVLAGRNLQDFSVSLPTTGLVSGGLTTTDVPVTHLYGSGNLNVRVGGNLYSGSFYEGSGTADIRVGGSVSSDWVGVSADTAIRTPTWRPCSRSIPVRST